MSTSPTTSDHGLRESVELKLDEIIPYWRNPRRIPEEAVSAVALSIKDYGMQQPIVVDANNTIVIGHTRYAALRRLKVEAPIRCLRVTGLSPEKVKQLRVIDNRAAEFTSWDFEQLMTELHELDQDLMKMYFPEADPIEDDGGPPMDNDVDTDPDRVLPWDTAGSTEPAEFVCPSCFHTWTMEVTPDQVRTGVLEVMGESA